MNNEQKVVDILVLMASLNLPEYVRAGFSLMKSAMFPGCSVYNVEFQAGVCGRAQIYAWTIDFKVGGYRTHTTLLTACGRYKMIKIRVMTSSPQWHEGNDQVLWGNREASNARTHHMWCVAAGPWYAVFIKEVKVVQQACNLRSCSEKFDLRGDTP